MKIDVSGGVDGEIIGGDEISFRQMVGWFVHLVLQNEQIGISAPGHLGVLGRNAEIGIGRLLLEVKRYTISQHLTSDIQLPSNAFNKII
jgi:hypothetical protein